MDVIGFAEWLEKEIENTGLSRNKFAKAADLSPAQLSRIINLKSDPGPQAVEGIARALKTTPDVIYRKLRSSKSSDYDDEMTSRFMYLIGMLPDRNDREEALGILEAFVTLRKHHRGSDEETAAKPSG